MEMPLYDYGPSRKDYYVKHRDISRFTALSGGSGALVGSRKCFAYLYDLIGLSQLPRMFNSDSTHLTDKTDEELEAQKQLKSQSNRQSRSSSKLPPTPSSNNFFQGLSDSSMGESTRFDSQCLMVIRNDPC